MCACACSCNIVDNFALFVARDAGQRSQCSVARTMPLSVHPVPCLTLYMLWPASLACCWRQAESTHTHREICVRRSLWHFEVCVTKQVTQKNSMSHVVATWLSFICCSAPSLLLSLAQGSTARCAYDALASCLPCRVAYTQRWRSED